MKKTSKFAALGLTAGLAAGGVTGLVLAVPAVAGAQSTGTTTETTPSTPSTGSNATKPDPGSRIADALAPLVSDGTLTQDQADKVVETLKDSFPGRGGPGMGRAGGIALDTAANALGMSADDLRTALRDGQTIAQIAQSKGVDVQTVIDALVAEAKTRLDERVTAGDITQAQADQRLADLTQRITDAVNNGFPARGDHGPGDHHPDDGAQSDNPSDTTPSTTTG